MLMPTDWHMSLLLCLSSMPSSGAAMYCDGYMEFHELCNHFGAASPFHGANHLREPQLPPIYNGNVEVPMSEGFCSI